MKRIILVCGSRSWTEELPITGALARHQPEAWIVLHGGSRGADSIAGRLALLRGFHVLVMNANWEYFGKKAGIFRNQHMIQLLDNERDVVYAFWDGESEGTLSTIELARDRGITVEVFRPRALTL